MKTHYNEIDRKIKNVLCLIKQINILLIRPESKYKLSLIAIKEARLGRAFC